MSKKTQNADGDHGAMRKDMRAIHRQFMLTMWLFLGFVAAIGAAIWVVTNFMP